ncbi:Ig-like domain repeat protein [Pararhodobacter sp.]|uniref:RCC1 domain-containing protein n=1 Tax=Pararhodobacter sp. TaxID=2127056 RepID=UPI002AFE8003|nr:Ig-like domain repeat protein [Pararhodobacter sp.]
MYPCTRRLLVLLCLLLALARPATAEGLFTTPPATLRSGAADRAPPFLATSRARDVILDQAYLAETIAPLGMDQQSGRLNQVPQPTRVRIELFPGIVLDFQRNSISEAFGGGYVWTGTAQTPLEALANLVIRDGMVTGHVEIGGSEPRSYRIDPIAPGGLHRITELDGAGFPGEGHPPHDGDQGALHDAPGLPDLRAPPDTVTTIDVLVAYTTAAATGIESAANLAISLANTGFTTSNVLIQYRLVGLVQVQNYAETDMETMLDDLRLGTQPGLQTVHAEREARGADLVSLLVSTSGQYCGIGYLPDVPSAWTTHLAYSVTAVNCISNHTFAHELGHNAGVNHDRYVVSPTPPDSADQYSYVDVPSRFRTIMAYANRCSDQGISCTRINQFSNPEVSYNGRATGILAGNPGAADAARWFNAVREAVAAYRPEVGSGGGPVNDNFANRTLIAASGIFAGTNVNATAEAGQPTLVTGATNIVWWRHTPTVNGQMSVSTCGSSFDTVLAVFTGAALDALTPVAQSDDFCGLDAGVTLPVLAGTEYQIAVAGKRDASGTIALTLAVVPSAPAATTTALISPGSGAQVPQGNPVLFQAAVSAPQGIVNGMVSFRRDGTEFAQSALDAQGQARASLATLPLGTHQITAHFLGSAGFTASTSAARVLSIVPRVVIRPANDDFTSRLAIATPGTLTGTTVDATAEAGQPTIRDTAAANAIWWRFTPASSGRLTINTCGSDFDTILAVFTGAAVNALALIDDDDDFCGLQSQVDFVATAGVEYQIAVAGYEGAEGHVTLTLTLQAAQVATTTTLTVPLLGYFHEPTPFTAVVSGPGGTPTGSISFRSDGVEFATGTLDISGRASIEAASLPIGSSAITAVYGGDGVFTGSTSAAQPLTIISRPQIVAGGHHSCARTTDRSLFCWGDNVSGQVGNASNEDQLNPQPIPVYSSDVALGEFHTCALRENGRPYCWGRNNAGQVGDGTTQGRWRPVSVPGLRRVTQVVAGAEHSCALHSNGTVSCWGANGAGQLGDRSFTDRLTPVSVIGLRRVTALTAGGNHTCALRDTGMVLCWGANESGQLGDGTTTNRSQPTIVIPFGRVRQISAGGSHTCALNNSYNVFCWGSNSAGQVGDGSFTDRPQAVRVLRLPVQSIAQVSTGGLHSCALTVDGTGFCWGSNTAGQLGDGTTRSRWRPVMFAGPETAMDQLTAGGLHSCGIINSTGNALCWGANGSGQLGNGSTEASAWPGYVVAGQN